MQMIVTRTFQPFEEVFIHHDADDNGIIDWSSHWFYCGDRIDITDYYDVEGDWDFCLDGVYDPDPENYMYIETLVRDGMRLLPSVRTTEKGVYRFFIVPKYCIRLDYWDGVMDQ